MALDIDTIYGKMVRSTNKYMGSVKLPGPSNMDKLKKLEHIRIKMYDRVLADELRKIPKMFPDIDRLHPFYRALIESAVPIEKLKSELGHIRAIMGVIASIRDEALYEVTRAKTPADLKRVRRKYLGRVWDVLKKNKTSFDLLRQVHRIVRRFPKVKFDEKTIVLAGFPNAGKSTLLKALTGSEPEIAPYPFTTKDIRIGHFEHHFQRFQVIDTPGLLDRPIESMNAVEKKAVAALRHLADLVVFLYDPEQDLEMQRDLLTNVSKFIQAPIVTAVNKADAFPNAADIAKRVGANHVISAARGDGVEELRKDILEKLGWYHGS